MLTLDGRRVLEKVVVGVGWGVGCSAENCCQRPMANVLCERWVLALDGGRVLQKLGVAVGRRMRSVETGC